MTLIKRGWQYSVYDIGNGRVVKRYNSFFTAWRVMMTDSFLHLHPPVIRFCTCYREGRAAAARSLAFLAQSSLNKSHVGNPRILSEFEYEQDKVETLGAVLQRVSVEEAKQLIDAFVDFTTFLFEHSLIEKNFTIASNFGLSATGEIILIDLGEICTTAEEIHRRTMMRAWSTADVLAGLPTNLRSYFVKSMDAAFLSERIKKNSHD